MCRDDWSEAVRWAGWHGGVCAAPEEAFQRWKGWAVHGSKMSSYWDIFQIKVWLDIFTVPDFYAVIFIGLADPDSQSGSGSK